MQRCTAKEHEWAAQGATKSWYCIRCGLIVFDEEPATGKITGRTPPSERRKTRHPPKGERWLRIIRALMERDGLRCFYCEHDLLDPFGQKFPAALWWPTIDHVLPLSAGGGNRLDNLVLACRACNHKKADHVKLLAEVIRKQRIRQTELAGSLERAERLIEHFQWELHEAGLGAMPGRAVLTGKPKKKWARPRPQHDTAYDVELGRRVCANLKAENLGPRPNRVRAIVVRGKATLRPRKNVLHLDGGRPPVRT